MNSNCYSSFATGIFKVVYGVTVESKDDKYYLSALGALEAIAEAFLPGAFLVEYFPFLWRIPSWIPGTGWQQRFLKWQTDAANLVEMPFAYASTCPRKAETTLPIPNQHFIDQR